jgi:hypothetical protein
VHPILAGGAPVVAAGWMRVEHDGGVVITVTVDRRSKAYCPDTASLAAVVDALAALGVAPQRVRRDQRPTVCAVPGPEPAALWRKRVALERD